MFVIGNTILVLKWCICMCVQNPNKKCVLYDKNMETRFTCYSNASKRADLETVISEFISDKNFNDYEHNLVVNEIPKYRKEYHSDNLEMDIVYSESMSDEKYEYTFELISGNEELSGRYVPEMQDKLVSCFSGQE